MLKSPKRSRQCTTPKELLMIAKIWYTMTNCKWNFHYITKVTGIYAALNLKQTKNLYNFPLFKVFFKKAKSFEFKRVSISFYHSFLFLPYILYSNSIKILLRKLKRAPVCHPSSRSTRFCVGSVSWVISFVRQ